MSHGSSRLKSLVVNEARDQTISRVLAYCIGGAAFIAAWIFVGQNYGAMGVIWGWIPAMVIALLVALIASAAIGLLMGIGFVTSVLTILIYRFFRRQ